MCDTFRDLNILLSKCLELVFVRTSYPLRYTEPFSVTGRKATLPTTLDLR